MWCALGAGAPINVDRDLVIRAWTTSEGLPQNTVNAIVQSRDGYLWLATREGLARFDGMRFRVFGLREGLRSVAVQSLLEDRQGVLWIGTDGGGLSRMSGSRIQTISLLQKDVTSETISALAEDHSGRIWVGTRAGIVVLENGRPVDLPALEPISRAVIYAIHCGKDGSIWISSLGHGLFQFRENRLEPHQGPPDNPVVNAYCLLEDRSGRIWAGVGNGVILYLEQGKWGRYTQAEGVPYAFVNSLAEGDDGTIWAGSLDEGVFCFQTNRFVALTMRQGLSGNGIRSLRTDREGNLWVGTRSAGINRISRRRVMSLGSQQGLTNDFTRGVAETADAKLWIGTIGGGLYTGTRERVEPFRPEPFASYYVMVESVLAAEDGSVWWGGARAVMNWRPGHGAVCFTNQQWMGSDVVTSLCEDLGGGLWIGTANGRLLHLKEGVFQDRSRNAGKGPITALVRRPDGLIWVGSLGGGVRGIGNNRREAITTANGLLSQSIRTLHADKEGDLWIGTAGGGLSRWRSGKVDNFTAQQGLGSDTISQIIEDDNSNLWLGCSQGIIRVRKSDLDELADGTTVFIHPLTYGVSDGMPVEECSSGFSPAGLKTRSGLLCFPTGRGLVFIDPHREVIARTPPAVLLEEVMVDGKHVESETADQPPTAERAGTNASMPKIILSPGRRALEINYTAINFEAPEKLRFRYRLQGADPAWYEAGGRRTAYYSDLRPGRYVFQVMAGNADAAWSEPLDAVALTLKPFLWQTAWFPFAAGLVGIGVLAVVLRIAERRRYHRRLALLETRHAVEGERLRISQDMHDHLGAVLTRVSQLSDMGLSDPAGRGDHKIFEGIGQQARTAVQSLDEIVWATNPKNDNLPRFAEYVSRFADEFFENTPVRCWQEFPQELPCVPLRADLRHNVFLAIQEALNNILKHSQAKEMWLRLTLENQEVRIEVEDNGRGFNSDAVAPGGNGLGNMKSRLTESGGRMELRSQPGQGTRIRFEFPVPEAGVGEGTL